MDFKGSRAQGPRSAGVGGRGAPVNKFVMQFMSNNIMLLWGLTEWIGPQYLSPGAHLVLIRHYTYPVMDYRICFMGCNTLGPRQENLSSNSCPI